MNTLRERFEWIFAHRTDDKRKPFNAKSLSKAAGISASHVGQVMRGDITSMHPKTIDKVARAAGVDPKWLAVGAGAPDDVTTEPLSELPSEPQPDARAELSVELHAESDDPRMENRPGFAMCLARAKTLRPQHPAWVWNAVAESDPLLTVPLTPIMLAEIADFLARHMPGPAPSTTRRRADS